MSIRDLIKIRQLSGKVDAIVHSKLCDQVVLDILSLGSCNTKI